MHISSGASLTPSVCWVLGVFTQGLLLNGNWRGNPRGRAQFQTLCHGCKLTKCLKVANRTHVSNGDLVFCSEWSNAKELITPLFPKVTSFCRGCLHATHELLHLAELLSCNALLSLYIHWLQALTWVSHSFLVLVSGVARGTEASCLQSVLYPYTSCQASAGPVLCTVLSEWVLFSTISQMEWAPH